MPNNYITKAIETFYGLIKAKQPGPKIQGTDLGNGAIKRLSIKDPNIKMHPLK